VDSSQFAKRLIEARRPEVDVAVGILWHTDRELEGTALSARAIAEIVHSAGGAMPNVSRLRGRLESDKRCIKARNGDFQISGRSRAELTNHYREFAGPMRPENSGSVLAVEPFAHSRKYIKNVLHQINASYDHALFDCCAVMCRRLFETLIIDAFDHQGHLNLIKDGNGEILMLSGLIGVLNGQTAFRVGRQTKQAAMKLKSIGDWSAHNRTFMAQRSHIDGIAHDLSVASMDLLHLAGQD
jgi:hypothetical protein